MSRCEDVKMKRCEDEKMWRWEDVKMRRCEVRRCEVRRCEDENMWSEKMWRWADVKMRRCEDEKMWRWEDVKMRRCEDEKMWRWEDERQTPTIGRTLRSDALGNKVADVSLFNSYFVFTCNLSCLHHWKQKHIDSYVLSCTPNHIRGGGSCLCGSVICSSAVLITHCPAHSGMLWSTGWIWGFMWRRRLRS